MKSKYVVISVLVSAVVFFLIGQITAEKRAQLHGKTAENLSTAMHGEAFAYAKYMLYADHARRKGHNDIADLFERNAKTERFEHFAEEAELAGLVGSDEDNLSDAVKGETWEHDHMYPDFAKEAEEAGDKMAALRFKEISEDEARHRDAFNTALVTLQGSPATAQK